MGFAKNLTRNLTISALALWYLGASAGGGYAAQPKTGQKAKNPTVLEETVEREAKLFTELDDSNYKSEVFDYEGPAVVMFYDGTAETRTWEGYEASVRMNQVLTEVAKQYAGKKDQNGKEIKFFRYNTDNIERKFPNAHEMTKFLREKYGTDYCPTTIMYNGGQEIDRLKGGPIKDFEVWISDLGKYWIEPNLFGNAPEGTYQFQNTGDWHLVSK